MERKRLETLDDQFCEFVARMVCLKPTLFVEYNPRLRSLVNDDPPTRDAQSAVCRACHATLRNAERGRLLCAKCRARPSVLQGSPLIHTMYCSSHPRFALNARTEQIVAHISAMRHIAEKECEMAEHLAFNAWQAFQRGNSATGDLNVRFSEQLVRSSAAYDATYTACNPRYAGSAGAVQPRHVAVTVGGLGGKLQQLVKHSVVAWLYNLDSMIRRRFGIPLASERGCMNSVGVVVEKFANLIADRVVRLEERGENPTKYVCALAFQHVIKCENVRCEHHAEALTSADIRSMRELARLAHERELPERRDRLVAFLRNPCPELLKFLPQVAQQYEFAQLATALNLCNLDPSAASQRLDCWHETVNAGALVEVLELAIKRTREWRPADFLPCVQFHDTPRPGPFLPPMGWEDNPLVTSWTLMSSATHAHRRTGLDPTGLRIVLMSSALMCISADSRFFRPGVVRCDLEHMGAMLTNHRILSNHAYHALTEQLLPYMVGEPWRVARTEIANWQGSHIEDDVRQAGALLGDFSVQEIAERFGRAARSSPVQLERRRDMHTALVRCTADKMVVKPPSQYEDWFPLAIDLLLPILGQLRQTMGISAAAPSNAIGDILRLLPCVRNWVPAEGKPLRLGLVEVKNKPSVKDLLKKLEAEKSPLARLRRIKSVNVWELDPDALAKVLGK